MTGTTQRQHLAIVDAYRSRLHDRHILLSPDIPPKKLRAAIESYAPYVHQDDVLALVDTTVRGSAKDGGMLTGTTLYGHEADGRRAKVDLHDLRTLTTDQRTTGSLVIADGRLVFSAGVVAFRKVEIFADMVRDVARLAKAALERPPTIPSQQEREASRYFRGT